MTIDLKTMKKNFGFNPKLSFNEVEYYLKVDSFQKEIKNDEVYALAKKITGTAHPTKEDKFDKKWMDFFLPLKKNGKTIEKTS